MSPPVTCTTMLKIFHWWTTTTMKKKSSSIILNPYKHARDWYGNCNANRAAHVAPSRILLL
ncbi:hypothetical protein QTP88_009191 [Uroleucon formosanum]